MHPRSLEPILPSSFNSEISPQSRRVLVLRRVGAMCTQRDMAPDVGP